jgi:hypothetical protein
MPYGLGCSDGPGFPGSQPMLLGVVRPEIGPHIEPLILQSRVGNHYIGEELGRFIQGPPPQGLHIRRVGIINKLPGYGFHLNPHLPPPRIRKYL